MEASSPSRSDSFPRGWLRCKARPAAAPSFERLDGDADAGLGHSFDSSCVSFIDMDPAELFSMRWTSSAAAAEEDSGFEFGLPCAGTQCYSPLLANAGGIFSDGHLLLPCEPSSALRVGSTYAAADVSPGSSSPAFHSAQSTPPPSVTSSRCRAGAKAGPEPLLATRRILLRYLRFLVPLCRKARALPRRVFMPRSTRALSATTMTTASPARRSMSSFASAAEYWCHGNADTAVRDAILYCKKSIGQDI